MFQLGKVAAQKRIFEEMTIANAAKILGWAISYNAGTSPSLKYVQTRSIAKLSTFSATLRAVTLDFVLKHLSEITQSQDFVDLMAQYPDALLQGTVKVQDKAESGDLIDLESLRELPFEEDDDN